VRIELDFTGDDSSAQRATESLVKALERIQAKAQTTERALEGVELDAGETAKTVANAKIIERALEGIENKAKQAERALDDLHTPVSRVPTPDGRQFAWAGGPASRGDANALSYVRGINAEWREVDKTLLNVKHRFDDIGRSQYDIRYDWLTGGGSRGSVARAGSDRGGGGGRNTILGSGGRRGGFGNIADDGSFQFDDLYRGLLPGGRRASVGATLLSGTVGLAGASAATPGLAGLLAAIPALASAAGASIATLAIGLGGLGDAIDGDKEAFDKLTPLTQDFVQEVRGFIPFLKEVQELTREGLFPGLTRGLNNLLSADMVETIRRSAGLVGGAVGNAAGDVGTFLGSGDRPDQIMDLARQTADAIGQLNEAGISWADTLLDLAVAGGPFTDWLLETNAELAESANAWVESKIASGEFADAMGAAQESLQLVGDLLDSFVGLVVNLGQALGPAGRDILTGLTDALDELSQTIADNDDKIQAFTQGAVAALRDVVAGTWPVVEDLAGALNDVAEAMGGWETAFKVILAGALAAKILELVGKLALLMGSPGAAGTGAGGTGILGNQAALAALKVSFSVGLPLAIAAGVGAGLKHLATLNETTNSIVNKIGSLVGGQLPSGTGGITLIDKNGNPVKGPGVITPGKDEGAGAAAHSGAQTRGIQLGTSQDTTHQTKGLGGYPAKDWFATPGTPVLAPEDGNVVRWSGKGGTSGQVYGWSLYFVGEESGNTYYITHLAANRAKVGGPYRKGAVLGYVSAWSGGSAHAHVGIHKGSGVASPGGTTPSPVGGDPPPFDPDKADKPTVDNNYELPLALRRRIARAAITTPTGDDIAAYRAAIARVKADIPKLSGEKEVDALQDLKSLMNTLENFKQGKAGSSKSSILAQILRIDEAQEDMADWDAVVSKYGAGLQKIENALKKALTKGITPEALAVVRDAISRQTDDIADAIRKEEELARKRAEIWRESSKAILDAFDEAARNWVSPTQMLLDTMNSARDEQQMERAIRDAEERVADARKRLEEAMSGRKPDSSATLDKVREITGRYGLASSIQKVQLGILGGGTGTDYTDQIVKELQDVLSEAAAGVVDSKEVADAQRALRDAEENLEDARYRKTVYHLQRKAEAEKDAHEREVAEQRIALENRLAEWGEFWVRFGSMMDMSIDDFLKVVQHGGSPGATVGAYTGQTTAQVAASQGMSVDQWNTLINTPYFGPGGDTSFGHVMAVGGPISRPTLLVDAATRRPYAMAGERGPEWISPMGGDGASTELVLEAPAELVGLFDQFVSVKVRQAGSSLSADQGTRASRYRREGRI
jgi:hypothetical protein